MYHKGDENKTHSNSFFQTGEILRGLQLQVMKKTQPEYQEPFLKCSGEAGGKENLISWKESKTLFSEI